MAKKTNNKKHRRRYNKYQLLAIKLERYLFPEGRLPFMPNFASSPDLMTIFVLLFDNLYSPEYLKNMENEDVVIATLEQKLRTLLQADTREIIRYKVLEDFYLTNGEFTPASELPLNQTVTKARTIKKNDTILVRIDRNDKISIADIQILTAGLFSSFDDDWRCFKLSKQDLVRYMQHLKRENRVCDGNDYGVRFNPKEYITSNQK